MANVRKKIVIKIFFSEKIIYFLAETDFLFVFIF